MIRTYPTKLLTLAERMVEHGPYRFKFDAVELGEVFDACATLLKQEKTLLRLEGGFVVVGNLEGSYGDLWRWFHKNGWPPRQKVRLEMVNQNTSVHLLGWIEWS